MSFPQAIKTALLEYDERKGPIRRLFGDHPAIKALRNLSEADQSNLFKLYQCFAKNPASKQIDKLSASGKVYQSVLELLGPGFAPALEQPNARLLTQMSFPQTIQAALLEYDERKGTIRRLFGGDHIAIKALRNLSEADQSNPFKLYQCFAEILGSKPIDKLSAFGKVYQSVLEFLGPGVGPAMEELGYAWRLTQANFDVVAAHARPENIAEALRQLNIAERINGVYILTQAIFDVVAAHTKPEGVAQALVTLSYTRLLTPMNRDAVVAHANSQEVAKVLRILNSAGRLTQANFDQLLRVANSFLCTDRASTIIWSRIPSCLLTQTVFDRLIVGAQAHNPEQHLQAYMDQLLPRNQHQQPIPVLNDTQSTHQASVHRSVSESAIKLSKRYGSQLTANGFKAVIAQIQNWIQSLPETAKNQAAKSCINDITTTIYDDFIDPNSQVTTRQLLGLVFLAINDDKNRAGSLEDAKAQFVQGLYEIQRGYNLSATGIDRGGKDQSICTAGTFNKLIEILQAIHPDVEILFISSAVAALKLPKIAAEATKNYLSTFANPQTVTDCLAFTKLIAQVKTEGIEVIWDQVKKKVADQMFEEFGSLWHDKKDPHFISFIEAGKYSAIENLSCFQATLQSSRGYQRYCSQILHNNSMGLFPPKKSQPPLAEKDVALMEFTTSREIQNTK